MILIVVGVVLGGLGILLRMSLGALAGMDQAGEAQAAAKGLVRAERHNRILRGERWMTAAARRVEGAIAVVVAAFLSGGLASVGLHGWLAVAVSVLGIAVARVAAAWSAQRWAGPKRLSGLVEVAAGLYSWVGASPVVDSDPADSHSQDLSEEKEMISSVLEFSETIVREVMVPRTDMVTVTVDAGLDELAQVVKEYGFSRFPVLDGGIDYVVGMALAKDLLSGLMEEAGGATVADIQRTPLYVPETKAVSDLLREMRRNGDHMAVVIDEHGGTAGLVTIEDLLEELVGEIVDEHDEHDEWLRAEEGGVWFVDGRYPVDDLGTLLGVALPQEDWDTVGGLVLALVGRVPAVGEVLTTRGVEFKVEEVLGHRVSELRVRLSGDRFGGEMTATTD